MNKVITIILDGFGLRDEELGNAVKNAEMENFTKLWEEYPHAKIHASGEHVGLSKGQFGNSEVGHTLIGAGRLIKQSEVEVADFVEEDYKDNELFTEMLAKKDEVFHIMGICSDGAVHGDINHMIKLYEILISNGIKKIYFHLITDGRDTRSNVAYEYISQLENKINEHQIGKISTICGRYYAMDRDKNMTRTKSYYNLVTKGIGVSFKNSSEAVNSSYSKELYDEFIKPVVIEGGKLIENDENIIFMNYRPDRAKQIVGAFSDPTFIDFPTSRLQVNMYTFLKVDESYNNTIFINKGKITNPLGVYLSELGISQARIAESEKYAHVTYFFDGGYEGKLKNCTKYDIASDGSVSYDKNPAMSSEEVTSKVIKCIEQDTEFILVNFANPDMVGHTGNMDAAVKACEIVDQCLGKIIEKADDNFYKVIILADHGNADKMVELDGSMCKTHTNELVPFIIKDKNIELKTTGDLTMVAPTILEYMDLAKPKEMQETESMFKDK